MKRDAIDRISGATTKKNATSAVETLASSIAYMPMSRLPQSFTYGNGLTQSNSFTLDYEVASLATDNGATGVCSVTCQRSDNLNITELRRSSCRRRADDRASAASCPIHLSGSQPPGFSGAGMTAGGTTNPLILCHCHLHRVMR